MEIIIEAEPLRDLKVIRPKVLPDDRGFFLEAYRSDEYVKHGMPASFVQENHSLEISSFDHTLPNSR